MKITSVHVTKFTDGKLRGIATVVLDDCFKIKGMRIYETDDKLVCENGTDFMAGR